MKRAAIYARVSTQEQAETGTSLQSQTEACRRYATQQGLSIAREIQENASGATLERRGLQEIRDLARAGHIDALICYTPDRLSRDLLDMFIVKQEIERTGASLLFVTVPKDDSPFGEAMLGMTAVMGKLERKLIQVRTKAGKDQRALNGDIIGSWMVPYGYSYDQARRRYVVVEAEAATVRRIFAWLAYDQESLHGVARRLFSMGIPTQRGGQWRPATLRLMIGNSVYKGEAVWNRRRKKRAAQEDRIVIPVPAIVSAELWAKANEQVEVNKRTYWRQTKADYLLSGVLVCAHCGRVYGGMSDFRKSEAGYGTYRCPMRWQGEYRDAGKCPSRTYNKRVLETLVWQALIDYLVAGAPVYPPQDALEGHVKPDPASVDTQALRKELEGCEREKTRVMDAYRTEVYTLSELQSQLAVIRERREIIERELARAQSVVRASGPEDRRTVDDLRVYLGEHGNELSFDHKRRIVRAAQLRIIANGNELALYALPDPARAFSVLTYSP